MGLLHLVARVSRLSFKIFSFFLVLFVYFFTFCLSYVLLGGVLPCYFLWMEMRNVSIVINSLLTCILYCVVGFMSFCIIFNFTMSVCIHPGRVPSGWKPEKESEYDYRTANSSDEDMENPLNHGDDDETITRYSRYCQRCKELKPPRTHHCFFCNCCVLKYEHHCPWIASCVGHYNHKYFLSFVVYVFLGCSLCSILCGCVVLFSPGFFDVWNIYLQKYSLVSLDIRAQIGIAIVFSLALALTMMCFSGWHLYLGVTGQTSLEIDQNFQRKGRCRRRKVQYQGIHDFGWRKNLELIFGSPRIVDWFLTSFRPPMGNGTSFQSVYSRFP